MNSIHKFFNKDQSTEYFLIDAGCLLIPYLQYRQIGWKQSNITPFFKMMSLFFSVTYYNPHVKFLVFIDNGIPENVTMKLPSYKNKRNHSIKRREESFINAQSVTKNNYTINRGLIIKTLSLLGHGVFYFNEADYQLGYALNKLQNEMNIPHELCYILTHDNDVLSLNQFAHCFQRKRVKNESVFQFYRLNEYHKILENVYRIESYDEYIIMKALLGDKIDNVTKPILIDVKHVKKLFNEWKYKDGFVNLKFENAFEIIKKRVLGKYKDSTTFDALCETFKNEFLRNYQIFDIYNSQWVFKPKEKFFIDNILNMVVHEELPINFQEAFNICKSVSSSLGELFMKWYSKASKTVKHKKIHLVS